MIFKLHKQKPKVSKNPLIGYLNVDEKSAMFFTETHALLTTLERPKMIYASTHGMMLSGFENVGNDKEGNQKFRYQEWYLIFPVND